MKHKLLLLARISLSYFFIGCLQFTRHNHTLLSLLLYHYAVIWTLYVVRCDRIIKLTFASVLCAAFVFLSLIYPNRDCNPTQLRHAFEKNLEVPVLMILEIPFECPDIVIDRLIVTEYLQCVQE